MLQERGIKQTQNESLSEYIARGLGLSDGETVRLLEALDRGLTIEEAPGGRGGYAHAATSGAGHVYRYVYRQGNRECAG